MNKIEIDEMPVIGESGEDVMHMSVNKPGRKDPVDESETLQDGITTEKAIAEVSWLLGAEKSFGS